MLRKNMGKSTDLKLLTKQLDPHYAHYGATLPVIDWDHEKMRALRIHLGWTQAQVAHAIDRDSQTYHSWENDKRNATTIRGNQKLHETYDRVLTPIYQACLDAELSWGMAVGTGSNGISAVIKRCRPHAEGLVREQTGQEFFGLFVCSRNAELIVSIAQYNTYDEQFRAAGGDVARQLAC